MHADVNAAVVSVLDAVAVMCWLLLVPFRYQAFTYNAISGSFPTVVDGLSSLQ